MHDVELLGDAKPAGLGARLVGGSRRQELPLQLRHQPFIFELPHMAGQLGSDSGPWVAEVGSVVGIPQLPRGRRHADVALSPPPRCCDIGLVDHLVILAPGTDWTVLNTSSAVAVLVEGVHMSIPSMSIYPYICMDHTFYLSQTPQTCLCKKKLAGVNFHRFNAKNWRFLQIQRFSV